MLRHDILIAGAGSIGSVIGFYLKKSGHQVMLLRRSGDFGQKSIKIVGIENDNQDMTIVNSNEIQTQKFDLIFLSAQRQQLESLLNTLKPTLSSNPQAILIPTQNGLNVAELIQDFLDSNDLNKIKVIQTIIWWSATVVNSSTILYHNKADTVIGIPNIPNHGKEDDLNTVSNVLSSSFQLVRSHNIELESKKKLVLNIVSPILAILKQPYPTALNDLITRKIVHAAFDEVVSIAQDEGWFEWDDRLISFHSILLTETNIDHYSISSNYPPHKVSTQISAEKYGGEGSNANELLYYFIDRNSPIAKILLELVLHLKPNYTAISSEELYNKLEKHISSTCNVKME